MRRLIHLPAIHVCRLRIVLVFLCIVPTQSVLADDQFPADDSGLYARALAAVPSVASEDMQSKSGDPQPSLRLRNSLIIGTGATLVAAYGLSNCGGPGLVAVLRLSTKGGSAPEPNLAARTRPDTCTRQWRRAPP